MSPVRIGLLSASRISVGAVIEPAQANPDVEVVAVAARDRQRADEFATTHAIPKVLDSYQQLCEDPDVDVVYISTPPSSHMQWTLAALAAGKHVFCEKPFAMNAQQARHMIDAGRATDQVLFEAFHWRYHPMAQRIAEIVGSGVLGTIVELDASFTIPLVPAGDFRWKLATGGGALMDLGCYPIQWVRFVGGAEPRVVSAQMVPGSPTYGDPTVDATVTAQLAFPDGVTARIHSDMSESSTFHASLRVVGTNGQLVVENPLAPQIGNSISTTVDGVETRESVERTTTYEWQLRALVAAVRNGAVFPTGGDDSINTMRVIDDVYAAAGFGPRPGSATG